MATSFEIDNYRVDLSQSNSQDELLSQITNQIDSVRSRDRHPALNAISLQLTTAPQLLFDIIGVLDTKASRSQLSATETKLHKQLTENLPDLIARSAILPSQESFNWLVEHQDPDSENLAYKLVMAFFDQPHQLAKQRQIDKAIETTFTLNEYVSDQAGAEIEADLSIFFDHPLYQQLESALIPYYDRLSKLPAESTDTLSYQQALQHLVQPPHQLLIFNTISALLHRPISQLPVGKKNRLYPLAEQVTDEVEKFTEAVTYWHHAAYADESQRIIPSLAIQYWQLERIRSQQNQLLTLPDYLLIAATKGSADTAQTADTLLLAFQIYESSYPSEQESDFDLSKLPSPSPALERIGIVSSDRLSVAQNTTREFIMQTLFTIDSFFKTPDQPLTSSVAYSSQASIASALIHTSFTNLASNLHNPEADTFAVYPLPGNGQMLLATRQACPPDLIDDEIKKAVLQTPKEMISQTEPELTRDINLLVNYMTRDLQTPETSINASQAREMAQYGSYALSRRGDVIMFDADSLPKKLGIRSIEFHQHDAGIATTIDWLHWQFHLLIDDNYQIHGLENIEAESLSWVEQFVFTSLKAIKHSGGNPVSTGKRTNRNLKNEKPPTQAHIQVLPISYQSRQKPEEVDHKVHHYFNIPGLDELNIAFMEVQQDQASIDKFSPAVQIMLKRAIKNLMTKEEQPRWERINGSVRLVLANPPAQIDRVNFPPYQICFMDEIDPGHDLTTAKVHHIPSLDWQLDNS